MLRGRARQQIWASDELRVLQKLYKECHKFVIQKVPRSCNRPRGLQDTICRHSDCPNKVTPPGSYRAYLEKLEDCDPASNIIGYEAIDSHRNVRRTPKGSQGRRGLGANGQEWWCLKCLEALFVDLRERIWKHPPDGSTLFIHPLTSIQYWIIPERRKIPQYDGIYYTVQSPQIHLLAKWQAVKTFDELCDLPAEGVFHLPEDPADGPLTLYLGRDGESFYLDRETRDLRGVLADGRICEIIARDVRGYSLSEALRKLDKQEDHMVEEKWKLIMAERRRNAGEDLEEGEGQYFERQLTGSHAEQGEAAGPEEPVGLADRAPPDLEGHRRALPINYIGNDLPETETSGKRKWCDLDQSQEPVRPSTFVPQMARTTLAHTVAPTSVKHPPRAEISPSNGLDTHSTRPQSAKGSTEVSTNEGNVPLILVSKSDPTLYATPTSQQSLPSKFAPKRTSRLCNRKRRGSGGVPVADQEEQQPVR